MGKLWSRVALLGVMVLSWAMADAQDASRQDAVPELRISASSRAELVAQVREQLLRWRARDGRDAAIRQVGMWRVPDQLDGSVRVTASVRSPRDGVHQVDIAVVPKDGKAGGLRFVLHDPQPVWVAAQSLARGEPLRCESFRRDWRVERSSRAVVDDACPGSEPSRLKRPLAVGEVLMASDVAPLSAVQDRQAARVLVRVGAIEVEATGVALADAQVGQPLPVKVGTSAAVLRTVVVAPGEARLGESLQ